jgi:hypothetical protein
MQLRNRILQAQLLAAGALRLDDDPLGGNALVA